MHVISPHLDDAVLSLGQFLACDLAHEVYTVFAGIPRIGYCTGYDNQRGFTSSAAAMKARRTEDRRALEVLGAVPRHFGFLDLQYRSHGTEPAAVDPADLSAELARIMSPRIHTFAPLGIGHPDHRLVARAARDAVPVGELLLYEELPYRVLWPEQVAEELERIRAEGWTVEQWPLEQGPRSLKVAAIERYKSQFPQGADDPCLLVPERVWRATRGV